ncbi:hypothetical protein MAR_037666 [Mya arenaria]|uniref:Uncharacterized protein n=1 Tax=Mya arenaria TaxID=6604 RepID=A0ABY7FSI8_MYAAR|nr:hypothetical protein MAR_037666 [Mya arenaria]
MPGPYNINELKDTQKKRQRVLHFKYCALMDSTYSTMRIDIWVVGIGHRNCNNISQKKMLLKLVFCCQIATILGACVPVDSEEP